jgi:transketolase
MAIAEHWLACRFNRPDLNIIDHYTYVVASDGDMEEGVSSEAASLAGALRLGKLIVFYDDNNISIEGDTNIAFRENVGARFQAYGWQVLGPINGNDITAVDAVIKEARADTDRPTLIICQTVIGYGSPEQATGKVHGEPLGAENVKAAKDTLGWPQEPTFYVPDDVLSYMRKHIDTGKQAEEDWNKGLATYTQKFPDLATPLQLCLERKLPDGWDEGLDGLFPPDTKPIATRNASGKVLNVLAKHIPELLGGAADLAPSTKTLIEDGGNFEPQSYCGRNMHYGVREHAMGAVSNGLIRHGGIIPYTGTILIFSDYMRPPMRLAALMGVRPIYVFTHDSIGLGEDGPTHQPVEQLMNLRAIPNFTLIRPADATETAEAWRAALQHTGGPVALVFTRQKLPVIDRTKYASAAGLHKGGYILWQSSDNQPDIILMATGSEVTITLQAGETLAQQNVNVRIVSMPCWKLFDQQPQDYRESVLPNAVRKRISVEAGAKIGWEHYVGLDGKIIGLDHFGASAPGETVMEKYGFTAQHIVEIAQELLG